MVQQPAAICSGYDEPFQKQTLKPPTNLHMTTTVEETQSQAVRLDSTIFRLPDTATLWDCCDISILSHMCTVLISQVSKCLPKWEMICHHGVFSRIWLTGPSNMTLSLQIIFKRAQIIIAETQKITVSSESDNFAFYSLTQRCPLEVQTGLPSLRTQGKNHT